MAKKSNDSSSGKIKFRFVEFEVEGSDATLEEGLRNIATALARGGTGSSLRTPARLEAPRQSGNGADFEDGNQPADLQDVVEEEDLAQSRTAKVPRKPHKPKFEDLNWAGNGKSWTAYIEEKGPETGDQKYLVASAWLTLHGGLPTFSAAQLYSCFQAAKWDPRSTDFTQPLRKMKSQNSYFENPESRTWKLTSIGLEAAKAITPQSAA